MKKTAIILSVLSFLIFATVSIVREVNLSAELSCFNSISSALNKNPELLSQMRIPPADGWSDLDAPTCVGLIKGMKEKGLIDCKRLNKEKDFSSTFKIQVSGGTNGVYKARVVTPGPDRQYGSSDDQVF